MSKSELIVGLDIGTTKICAVVGEPSENGGMDIVGIGTSPSTGLRKAVPAAASTVGAKSTLETSLLHTSPSGSTPGYRMASGILIISSGI